MTLLNDFYIRAEKLKVPLNVLIELTQACNASCLHCYIKSAKEKFTLSPDNNELTLKQYKELFEELAGLGALNLIFTGGEALLRKDFFEIAFLAKEMHFALSIFSNGILIDENISDKLSDLQPVSVYFSLYGKDSLVHDRITGADGSFLKVCQAIKLLKERGIAVGLKTMVMRDNFPQLKEIYSLGKESGVNTHDFGEEITRCIDGSCSPQLAQLDEKQLYEYYRGNIPGPFEYREELSKEEAMKKQLCAAGTFGACISAYGDIYPCAELRVSLGNIKRESFSQCWKAKNDILEELRLLNTYGDLEACRECRNIAFCRRCPGRAFSETGDWKSCYPGAILRSRVTRMINSELEPNRKEQICV
mgnify:CR=1 FL=1